MLQLLLGGGTLSLADWLADPLPGRAAEVWLRETRERLRTCCRDGPRRFHVRLAEIIARHWCGEATAMNYRNLLAVLDSDCHRAQLELCYGQLLIACKRRAAWRHLDDGFELAANLLEPEEYFVVLRRHDRLRHLPLSENGTAPADLESLLREAGVISRLSGRGRSRRTGRPKHQDTID